MASRNERSVFTRLKITGTEDAKAKLRAFGRDGETAFRRVETAAAKPSKSLMVLDRNVDRTTGSLRRMGTVTSVLHGPLGGIASRFSGLATLISGAGVALGGFALATGAATFAFGKAIRAAEQYERSMFKISALLKTTGNASGLTAGQIDALAFSIGKATLASTTDVRNSAAALLSFKAISGDAFGRTLRLAQDLASLGMGSLQSATVQLGKALEDPILGLSALREVGVSFTNQQREMIVGMVEFGDVAGAQTEILNVLENQVGGAAAGEGKGLTGAFDSARESWTRLMERFGQQSGGMGALQAIAHSFENFSDILAREFAPTLDQQVSELVTKLTSARARLAENQQHPMADFLPSIKSAIPLLEAEVSDVESALDAALAKVKIRAQEERNAQAAAKAAANRRARENEEAQFKEDEEKAEKIRQRAATQKSRRAATERKTALGVIAQLELSAANEGFERLNMQRDRDIALAEDRADRLIITATELAETERLIQAVHARESNALWTKQFERLNRESKKASKQRAKDQAETDAKTFGGGARKAAADYFEVVRTEGEKTGRFVAGSFQSLEDSLTQFFESGKFSFVDFFGSIKSGLARLAAQDVVGTIGGVLGIGGSAPSSSGSIIGGVVSGVGSFLGGLLGFKSGGMVRGAGTSKSDSVPALLSTGEFVVNAAATRQCQPLLEAINARGFSSGGMVAANSNVRRFASGGNVGHPDQDLRDGGFDPALSPEGHLDRVLANVGHPDAIGKLTLGDRFGAFVGKDTMHGFKGSTGAGLLTAGIGKIAGGALFGGPIGMLLGGLFSIGANFFREKATKGAATGTGIAGILHEAATTNRSVLDIVRGNLTDNVGRIRTAFAGGSGGGIGSSGRIAAGNGASGLTQLTSAGAINSAGVGVDGRTAFARDAAGRLALLRGGLDSRFDDVERNADRVLRGLASGGRVAAGESIIVGEGGQSEIFHADRPGVITPKDQVLARDDRALLNGVAALANAVERLASEQAETNRHVKAAAIASASGGFGRRTAS